MNLTFFDQFMSPMIMLSTTLLPIVPTLSAIIKKL